MGLFKSKYEVKLDLIIQSLVMNLSNNYKDNAQDDLRELEETLQQFVSEGKLKEKQRIAYESTIQMYKEKLKGFSHKDQKPYWT